MTNNPNAPKRIAVFIGTRPEGIKMAPVIRALDAGDGVEPVVISTGQHRELLDQVVDLFEISISENLEVMRAGQTLAGLTARLMTSIDEALERVQPDMILVQGDTTTVMVGALAAFYRRIPIGHVEAGLRTGDIWSPFPEEVNRTLVAPMVNLHFAPTETAKQNLLRENVAANSIHVTGNTVIDALLLEVTRQDAPGVRDDIWKGMRPNLGEGVGDRPFVLVTGHRRENFGGGFMEICDALAELADRFEEMDFVYPVHLNPNVQGPVHERLAHRPNIHLIAPVPYSEFVALMAACTLVLTDSGGVQEEAPTLGKPVLVMRDTTERPEGIEAGTVRLTRADRRSIVDEVSRLVTDDSAYESMSNAVNPYGDGRAAPRIVEAVKAFLS